MRSLCSVSNFLVLEVMAVTLVTSIVMFPHCLNYFICVICVMGVHEIFGKLEGDVPIHNGDRSIACSWTVSAGEGSKGLRRSGEGTFYMGAKIFLTWR